MAIAEKKAKELELLREEEEKTKKEKGPGIANYHVEPNSKILAYRPVDGTKLPSE